MSWPLININDICRPKQWKTVSSANLLDEGYPVYGANGQIGYYSEYTHELPTLMITCRGATCGNVHISVPKAYINGNAMALDGLDKERVYIKYLFYYFQSRGFKDVISGSAQPQITRQGLSKIEIPLPPLPVQKQIAAVLEKADTLRGQCHQMEQELHTLAQSVFIDMFGDPVLNPHNFTIKKISELVFDGDKVNYGVVQPGDDYEGGAPLIRISDFENEKVVLDNLKYISPEIDKKHKKSKLRGNEVLIACVGATIGKLALASEENKGMNIARAVVRVSPNEEITPYYLLNYLKSAAAQRHFLKETRAVGQPTLNVGLIASCPVLIPPKDLQKRFQCTCENISNEIVKVKELNRQHELAFNSLMQRAFKGELNLEDVA